MGKRNYLIEGVSGTGKTSVCQELRRRGYVAIHGDRELRYQGRPTTFPLPEIRHEHNLSEVEKVWRLAANQDDGVVHLERRNKLQFVLKARGLPPASRAQVSVGSVIPG